jgi:hypothetical protein
MQVPILLILLVLASGNPLTVDIGDGNPKTYQSTNDAFKFIQTDTSNDYSQADVILNYDGTYPYNETGTVNINTTI